MNSKELKTITCPRCLGFIPSNEFPGMYPGAISRVDNKTEICSDCGVEEALLQYTGSDLFTAQWPIGSDSAWSRATTAMEATAESFLENS